MCLSVIEEFTIIRSLNNDLQNTKILILHKILVKKIF